MNPVLEAISNNVSALPAATSTPQAGSGQRGSGGFASTLAAAQGFSTTSQIAAGAGTPETQSAGTATKLNVGMLAPANPQSRKLPSSGPLVAAGEPTNVAASQIPSVVLQLNVPQLSITPPSQMPTLAPVAPLSAADAAAQNVPRLPATAYSSAAQITPFSYSTLSQTAGISESSTGSEGAPGNLTGLSTPGVSPGEQISDLVSSQSTTMAPIAGASALSLPTTREQAVPSSGPRNGFENGVTPAEPTLLAGNIQPPAVTEVQPSSRAALASAAPDTTETGIQANGLALGLGTAASAPPKSLPPINEASAATPAPVLLANASAPVGTAAGVLPSPETNLQSVQQGVQANASDAMATGSVNTESVNQDDVALPTGTANVISEIINGQKAAQPILNLPGRASPQFAAARGTAGVSVTSVRGAGQSPAAISSSALSSSAPATGSGVGNESPTANQTPFSIFFSSAGPGTEAAASALPRMILPVTSSTIRNSYTTATETPGTGPQAGSSQSNVIQNAAVQPPKDALAASQGGSLPTGQPIHSNADPGASNVPAVASQSPAALPAPLASAAVAVPLGGQPGLPSDSLPKQETLPGSAAGGASSLVAAAPQVPPTAPGPVQVAQLVTRVGQSEIRIGMNTSAFGGVEVRTVVHANDVGLIIGSEKGDLRGLLANEMPAIANTLQQQNLRLNSVNFMQGFAFSNNASGGGDSQQQRSFVPTPASANSLLSTPMVDDPAEALLAAEFGGGGNSLSILA